VTAVYLADTPALLSRTMTHLVTARVVGSDGESIPLELEQARSSFDGTRTPRVTAEFVCRLPTDQSLLERLDPRTPARLLLSAGYRRPDGLDDVQQIANLSLRNRYASRAAGSNVLRIRATSDEALLADAAPAAGLTVSSSSTTQAIRDVVDGALAGLTWNVTATTAGPAVAEQLLDADRVAVVNDYRDRIGADVYADEDRIWNITDAPALLAGTAAHHTMTVGPAGTITDTEAGLDRDLSGADGWYNRVYLYYRWRDLAGAEQRIQVSRSVTTGAYAVTNNLRCLRLERNVATNVTAAGNVAAALVARTVTRGRTFTVSGVAAYWLRPGNTVALQLPLGGLERHLVDSVDFDHVAGRMTLKTRVPDNSGTIA
jgi:hypothetical protein